MIVPACILAVGASFLADTGRHAVAIYLVGLSIIVAIYGSRRP